MADKQTPINEHVNTLEREIEKIVLSKSVPAIPDNIKEILVKIAPWFAAISMFMLLPLIFAALGISAVALPFSYLGGMRMGFGYTIQLIFSVVLIGIQIMAIPGLFKRKASAWRLMFYSTLISLVQQLLSFDVVGVVVGGAISFYILVQVKSKYTK